MTLKNKQKMYDRFESKMESACYQCIAEHVTQHGATVSDTFIIDDVVPVVWEYLEDSIELLIKKHISQNVRNQRWKFGE